MSSPRIPSRSRRQRICRTAILWCALGSASCAGLNSIGQSPAAEIPQSIEGLSAAIESDREALTVLLSQTGEEPIEDRADALIEIAIHLAAMQEALAELESSANTPLDDTDRQSK